MCKYAGLLSGSRTTKWNGDLSSSFHVILLTKNQRTGQSWERTLLRLGRTSWLKWLQNDHVLFLFTPSLPSPPLLSRPTRHLLTGCPTWSASWIAWRPPYQTLTSRPSRHPLQMHLLQQAQNPPFMTWNWLTPIQISMALLWMTRQSLQPRAHCPHPEDPPKTHRHLGKRTTAKWKTWSSLMLSWTTAAVL